MLWMFAQIMIILGVVVTAYIVFMALYLFASWFANNPKFTSVREED